MPPCIMEQLSLSVLAQASHSQVQQWPKLSSRLSCASSFSALPQSRSHPRTCSVLPLPLVSQPAGTPLAL